MSEPATWLFYPKWFEQWKDESPNLYNRKKVYKDEVKALIAYRGDTITIFDGGDVHYERPADGKPRYKPAEQALGNLAMFEAKFLGEPGIMFVVDGLPRFWCDNAGGRQAYDYVVERMLSPEETSYRLENLADHNICSPE